MKNILAPLLVILTAAGCSGYTTQTGLPEHIKTIHVRQVKNEIDISQEVSSDKVFQTYRPGLEVELRNALIERFVFDGHLKIGNQNSADAIAVVALKSFDREPVRYNEDDSIQEFQIAVTASVKVKDRISDEVIFETDSISGDADYFVSGSRATSEDEAVAEALEDLVREIVEHILEVW